MLFSLSALAQDSMTLDDFFLSKSKDLCGCCCSSYHFFTFDHLPNPIGSKDYPDRKESK